MSPEQEEPGERLIRRRMPITQMRGSSIQGDVHAIRSYGSCPFPGADFFEKC